MNELLADTRHKTNKTTLDRWDGVEMNAPVDALRNTSPLASFIITPYFRNYSDVDSTNKKTNQYHYHPEICKCQKNMVF